MASDMYLIWGSGSPPCWRVMIALEEKKLQGYKHKLVSFDKGEHKLTEVLDINPRGEVPAFRHGANIINESVAACMYLESQFKSQGNQLTSSDPAEQALVYQRSVETLNLQQKTVDLLTYNERVPVEERHEGAVKRDKEAVTTELQLWEGYLQKSHQFWTTKERGHVCLADLGGKNIYYPTGLKSGPYLAGKNFSLADVVFFPALALAFRLGLRTTKYPKLGDYYAFLKDRPSIKSTWPPHWQNPPTMDPFKDL